MPAFWRTSMRSLESSTSDTVTSTGSSRAPSGMSRLVAPEEVPISTFPPDSSTVTSARLLLGAAGRVPPLLLAAVPFLILAAPLARATELRADRLAAAVVPSYAVTLAEVTDKMGRAETFLYPSLSTRVRSARNVSV